MLSVAFSQKTDNTSGSDGSCTAFLPHEINIIVKTAHSPLLALLFI
jgi:hypothetical protein